MGEGPRTGTLREKKRVLEWVIALGEGKGRGTGLAPRTIQKEESNQGKRLSEQKGGVKRGMGAQTSSMKDGGSKLAGEMIEGGEGKKRTDVSHCLRKVSETEMGRGEKKDQRGKLGVKRENREEAWDRGAAKMTEIWEEQKVLRLREKKPYQKKGEKRHGTRKGDNRGDCQRDSFVQKRV